MKLTDNDQVWVAANQEEYLLVMNKGRSLPRTQEVFLLDQVNLLSRLVAEASDREVAEANRRLEDDLPSEESLWLPTEGFRDPTTPRALMFNPASLGSRLALWKQRWAAARRMPFLPDPVARKVVEQEHLLSYLDNLL